MTKAKTLSTLTVGLSSAVLLLISHHIVNNRLTLPIVIFFVLGGLASGALFTWYAQYLTKILLKRITVETENYETILKVDAANHFQGREGVGGKLVLTDKRLIFKSHKYNIQNHQEVLDLDQISKLDITRPIKLLQNGLTIELINNAHHRFIVEDPGVWIELIKGQHTVK